MSTSPEADFDLEKLFLPAWAQESPSVNRYAKHPGDDRPERKFDDRSGGRRPPRRDGPRPGGARGNFRRDDRGGNRGDHRQREERREPMAPLPEINVTLMPDDKGVDSLS